jgi:hypothetical protein
MILTSQLNLWWEEGIGWEASPFNGLKVLMPVTCGLVLWLRPMLRLR